MRKNFINIPAVWVCIAFNVMHETGSGGGVRQGLGILIFSVQNIVKFATPVRTPKLVKSIKIPTLGQVSVVIYNKVPEFPMHPRDITKNQNTYLGDCPHSQISMASLTPLFFLSFMLKGALRKCQLAERGWAKLAIVWSMKYKILGQLHYLVHEVTGSYI